MVPQQVGAFLSHGLEGWEHLFGISRLFCEVSKLSRAYILNLPMMLSVVYSYGCILSFLGKMYCLSSEETLRSFSLNPRPCLLPPMPIPPCKIFVFGPVSSGKTTLCNLIAEYFKGKVTICLAIVLTVEFCWTWYLYWGCCSKGISPLSWALLSAIPPCFQQPHISAPISWVISPWVHPTALHPQFQAYIHSWWFWYLQILFSQHPSLSAPFPLLSRDLVSTLKCKEIILNIAVRQLKAGGFRL